MALHFEKYAIEANSFLSDYAKALNMDHETAKAGRILSAILHALRDIIPFEESLQLIAQLPMFLKAVYVNGWSVKTKSDKKIKSLDDFIALIKKYDRIAADKDFETKELTERYLDVTFILLRKYYLSIGELEDIKSTLPKELKDLIYTNSYFNL
ncbi:DUF2267 domain-containing protein [Spongiivirga sp. MCCC 1A20706]|uniref:DUF2267 domain-containing protein n=1 Tax=Spongiivirga sp. MCCC 1A20706 TaxID=3160963 RepID=UPI003977584C